MRVAYTLALILVGSTTIWSAQDLSKADSARQSPEAFNFVVERADVPMYPLVAKMARIQGTVRVTGTISHGEVVRTKLNSDTSGPLGVAAEVNLKSWKFSPSVNGELTVTYEYVLEKEEEFPPSNSSVEMKFPLFVKVTAVPAAPRATF